MDWTLEKEIVREAEYVSGRWHLHKDAKGAYISNWDLILFPTGSGANEKEAFDELLKKIEVYKSILEAAKREAESKLAKLEGEKMPEERKEKFSPGPWHIKPREKWEGRYGVSYSRITILTDPEKQYSPRHVIATVARGNGREEANAALIAAAPELYKCLQSILANCVINGYYRGPAEALLSKARGEAENAAQ